LKIVHNKANQAWLRARCIRNGILKKEAHHIQLTVADQEQNQQKSLVRRQIERIFARLKKLQHYRRVRYLGLARNQLELTFKAVAYNLKRLAGTRKKWADFLILLPESALKFGSFLRGEEKGACFLVVKLTNRMQRNLVKWMVVAACFILCVGCSSLKPSQEQQESAINSPWTGAPPAMVDSP
jgi:hypothetical protein